MKKVDVNYFPGWTRKSISFTMDDGRVDSDTRLLNILRPAGFLGTFNLCSQKIPNVTPEVYLELYRGYEIANHCKNHPKIALLEGGVDEFIRLADEGREELESVFGKGNIRGFVWPFNEQGMEALEILKTKGYDSIRKTGTLLDSTGFNLPRDRMRWSYNAVSSCLLDVMDKYENYPDDGRLKTFILGVHSYDFDRTDNWCDLQTFADKYGNRPESYFYCTVSEIFDYEDAIAAIEITDTEVVNPTELTLYIKVDGKRVMLMPRSSYSIK